MMVSRSSEWMMLLRFMMVPISYPKAIRPPRIRTLTYARAPTERGLRGQTGCQSVCRMIKLYRFTS